MIRDDIMKNKIVKSIHPNWEFYDKKSDRKKIKKIIIGTMPPYELCIHNDELESDNKKHNYIVNFFYGSKDNDFWPIINEAIGNKKMKFNEEMVNECKNVLREKHIDIKDVIKECIHKIGQNGKPSAADEDLLSIKYSEDLLNILNDNDCKIYCTSAFTFKLLKQFCIENVKEENKKERYYKVTINNKDYDLFVLYSPSNTALRGIMKANDCKNDKEKAKNKRLEQYKNMIYN